MPLIKTSHGWLHYHIHPLYPGVKRIDKAKALDNLRVLAEEAGKAGLRFLLGYGSVLGAMREHDFIAHDEDIDLILHADQRQTLLDLLPALVKRGFEIARWDKRGLLSVTRDGEYIDFYIFSPLSDKLYDCCGEPLPRKFLDDSKTIDFLGLQVCVPADTEEALEFWYGPSWRTPIQYFSYGKSRSQIAKAYIFSWIKVLCPMPLLRRIMRGQAAKLTKPYIDKGRLQPYL